MPVGLQRDTASARRTAEKADLHQIRLINILQGDRFLANRGGKRIQSDRAAAIVSDDACKHRTVNIVQPKFVNFQRAERHVRALPVDRAAAAHLRKIAHTAQQAVGDTRRATAAARNLKRARVLARHIQNARGAFYDFA